MIDVRRVIGTALAIGGYLAAAWMYVLYNAGDPTTVGGDLTAYLRAGSDLLAGRDVYVGQIGDLTTFPYAPTWAVLFAGVSWVPAEALQAVLVVADLLAIRYIAGSWRSMGYALWIPLLPLVMVAANIDILIAGAIVMAWRRSGVALTLCGLAKIAPFLGLPIPWRREVFLTLLVAFIVTLPWLGLWLDWIAYLLRQPAMISISLPFGPWWLRLPFALALLLPRRSYLSALAVIVAMPSLYLSTLSMLIAPIFLFLDERQGRGARARGIEGPDSAHASSATSPAT